MANAQLKNRIAPNARAIAITAIAVIAGAVSIAIFPIDWTACWPLILVYAAILINTYFSVSYFSKIIPADVPSQRMIDAALVVLYLALAATLGDALRFMATLTVYFAIATLKYAVALPIVARPALLYRKIKMDGLGTAGAALALCGAIFSNAFAATALWAVVFSVATAHVFFIKPLYADGQNA
jgi:hypothetical protein